MGEGLGSGTSSPVESPPIKQGFVMFTCVNTVET